MNLQKAVLTNKENLTKDIFEFTFEPKEELKFKAGQFITLKIEDKKETPCFRAYSIASPPQETKEFKLCIKIMQNGRASTWFKSITPGTEIQFIAPQGELTLNKKSNKNILFIANGTGVAPFKSMIQDQLNEKTKRKIHLIFGVRHIKGIFYKELFENLAKNHKNFTFDITISQPEDLNWKGLKGRTTVILDKMDIDTNNTEAYTCGLKEMVEDVARILKGKGMDDGDVYFEKYN